MIQCNNGTFPKVHWKFLLFSLCPFPPVLFRLVIPHLPLGICACVSGLSEPSHLQAEQCQLSHCLSGSHIPQCLSSPLLGSPQQLHTSCPVEPKPESRHSRYIKARGPGPAGSTLPISGGNWHPLHKVILHKVTQQFWLVLRKGRRAAVLLE